MYQWSKKIFKEDHYGFYISLDWKIKGATKYSKIFDSVINMPQALCPR